MRQYLKGAGEIVVSGRLKGRWAFGVNEGPKRRLQMWSLHCKKWCE